MSRAAANSDAFHAVADPTRRAILDQLRSGSAPVTEIAANFRMSRPAVSKHLSVLRKVGLVSASKDRRRRLYKLNAQELKPVHDWAKTFERFWTHQLSRIKDRAEQVARRSPPASSSPPSSSSSTR